MKGNEGMKGSRGRNVSQCDCVYAFKFMTCVGY